MVLAEEKKTAALYIADECKNKIILNSMTMCVDIGLESDMILDVACTLCDMQLMMTV